MFEIQATKRLIVTAFDIHTSATSNTQVLVYFRKGTYVGFDSSAVGWEKIADTTVTGKGLGNPSPISRNSFSAISLEAGETGSFYFQLSDIFVYSASGIVLPSDSNLSLLSSMLIFSNFGGTFMTGIWDGVIYYST